MILQRDDGGTNSQLVALAPATGRTLRESPRPLAASCYATPMVWRHEGTEELIIQGKGRVAAYSMKGGEPKWWVRGWGFSAVTTPVAGDGLLFAGGSGMGDPTEPDDPILDRNKLITDHDANQDGRIALDEMPQSVLWHIRREIPITVPGKGFWAKASAAPRPSPAAGSTSAAAPVFGRSASERIQTKSKQSAEHVQRSASRHAAALLPRKW